MAEIKPEICYYQQEFDYQGERKTRSGFICQVKLEQYDQGIILPHQELLPDKISGNKGPVLGLYADFSFNLDKLIRQAAGDNVDKKLTDDSGVIHSLTAIEDADVIQQLQQQMERQRIFIAAGHHSYDAALQHQKENPEAEYITMALMNLYDPNLIILPVHRLVKDVPNFNVDSFMQQLREDFVVAPFAVNPNGENIQDFMHAIYKEGGFELGLGIEHRRVFGLYTGNGQGYLVTLDSESAMDRLMPREGYSLALQGLDVFVLHYTILQRLLGIGKKIEVAEEQTPKRKSQQKQDEADIPQGSITYTRNEAEALKKVDNAEYQLAFFLNPVVFDEFTSVAIGGELMPPKSTYFYPPVPTEILR